MYSLIEGRVETMDEMLREYSIEVIGKAENDGITITSLWNLIKTNYPKLNTSNLRIREIQG